MIIFSVMCGTVFNYGCKFIVALCYWYWLFLDEVIYLLKHPFGGWDSFLTILLPFKSFIFEIVCAKYENICFFTFTLFYGRT